MTRRSTPSAIPADGGRPSSSAARKRSSIGWSGSPRSRRRRRSSSRRRLEPGGVGLEPLDHRGVARLRSGQRAQRRRPVAKEHRAIARRERRLDPGQKRREEEVVPRARLADLDPGGDDRPPELVRRLVALERDPDLAREEIADGLARPRRRELHLAATRDHARPAGHRAGHLGAELLGVARHRLEVVPRPVPLEHGELLAVVVAHLARAEAAPERVDPLHPGAEQPLHVVLGRRDEVAPLPRLHRAKVRLEPRRAHQQRRLHLDEAPPVEEAADRGEGARARGEPVEAPPRHARHFRAGRRVVAAGAGAHHHRLGARGRDVDQVTGARGARGRGPDLARARAHEDLVAVAREDPAAHAARRRHSLTRST
jgi:hypothetical protein